MNALLVDSLRQNNIEQYPKIECSDKFFSCILLMFSGHFHPAIMGSPLLKINFGLFLGSLFCSIDLCVCLCASTVLF